MVWVPADEKQVSDLLFRHHRMYLTRFVQFLSFEAAHIVYLLLDHGRKNPLIRCPIQDIVQNIPDIGTAAGYGKQSSTCLEIQNELTK